MDQHDNDESTDQSLMQHMTDEDATSGMIMHINLNLDNEDYWAYLMVPSNKYNDFMAAQAKGLCNIKEYGDVIEWGEGLEPPAHILQKLQDEYGVMPELADTLHNMTNSLEERLARMGGKKE